MACSVWHQAPLAPTATLSPFSQDLVKHLLSSEPAPAPTQVPVVWTSDHTLGLISQLANGGDGGEGKDEAGGSVEYGALLASTLEGRRYPLFHFVGHHDPEYLVVAYPGAETSILQRIQSFLFFSLPYFI